MLDAIDRKLLLALIKDSRTPVSVIAKQARVSRDVAAYRIKRLVEKGVIRDFITEIDVSALGYVSALLFVSVKASAEQEFISYIDGLDFVSWAGTHLGFWSMGMAIYGRDNDEVEERFQRILSRYGSVITDHRFAFYKSTRFFTEKYFGGTAPPERKGGGAVRLDENDRAILRLLSKNARMSTAQISRSVKLTLPAIAARIRKLEKGGVILKYTVYVNVFKVGLYLFVFFIQNRNLENRRRLYSFLEAHPNVSLLLDYVGDPFIEFGLFVSDPYLARGHLQAIKEAFPENELVDFFLTQEDFVSYGAPRCLFG